MNDTHSNGKHAHHFSEGSDGAFASVDHPSRVVEAPNVKQAPDLSDMPTFTPDGRWANGDINMGASGGHHHHHHRHRRTALVVAVTLVAFVTLFGVGAFLFYRSAMNVKTQAAAMASQAGTLQTQILSGNTGDAQTTASSMAAEARSMQDETSGFLWNLASVLPVYGSDISKVRSLASTANDLSENALVPLASQLSGMSLSSVMGEDGTIDVASLSNLASALTDVAPVVARSAATVDDLGSAQLEQIDTPLQEVKGKLDQLNVAVSGAAAVAPLLPSLLGANGQTETYLIVAQNSVEIRSTGGFPGSCGTLSVTDGRLSLGEFMPISWQDGLESPPVTAEEASIFGETLLEAVVGDANTIPDFTRAAAIWQWAWQEQTGTTINGVVAVDPVFLQQVLGLVGGITMSDGSTLDGSNAAEVLSHGIYLTKTPAAQDAYFEEAAKKSFDKLTSSIGTVDLTSLVSTVQTAVQDHRLYIWLADADQQKTLSSFDCSGALSSDETAPELGVYVTDGTGSKMDWYLDLNTQVGAGTRNTDGTTSYQVTTNVHNTLTDSEMTALAQTVLPDYIYGVNPYKRSKGDMITKIFLFAPAGGSISNIQVSGYMSQGFSTSSYENLQVLYGLTADEPGETTAITYTVTTSAKATSDLTVESTPLAR